MRYFYLISLAALPLCLPGCTDVPGQTKLKRGVTFEVHTVAAQAGPNTEPVTDPHTGDVLNLVKPPIITSNNVDTTTVTIDHSAQVLFEVNVDGSGAAGLSAATVGPRTQVAIVVNGKIVSAPVAHTPISSSFRVSGAYTRADWEKLVE